MLKLRAMEILAVAIILAAGAVLGTVFLTWPPRTDRPLHKAIGSALAQEALALAGPAGQITVITRDTDAFPQPALDVLLKAFRRDVRRGSGQIGRVKLVEVDPLRPVEVPAGEFFELIRRTPPGQVIVSLLGPPLLSEEQWSKLRPVKPRIVAFCSGNVAEMVNLNSLFESGYLHAAVVSRPLRDRPTGARQWSPHTFEELYQRVTAANRAQTLPALNPSL